MLQQKIELTKLRKIMISTFVHAFLLSMCYKKYKNLEFLSLKMLIKISLGSNIISSKVFTYFYWYYMLYN